MGITITHTNYRAATGINYPQIPDPNAAPKVMANTLPNTASSLDQAYFSPDYLANVSSNGPSINLSEENGALRVTVGCSSYSTSGGYAHLARASTQADVQAVIGETYRNIASFRMVASLGDDTQRSKARAAIASLQKLILRSRQKADKLSEEYLIQLGKKRAEKNQQRKKAKKFEIELNQKKARRLSADSGLRTEGHLDDVNNAYRFYGLNEHDGNLYAIPFSMDSVSEVSIDSSAGEMTEGAMTTEGAIT